MNNERQQGLKQILYAGHYPVLFHSPILGSVGVGLCKYRSIITSDIQTKPTLLARMK